MRLRHELLALFTIVRGEVGRVLRLWPQTLLPSAVTTCLYYIIFGHVIGQRIGAMEGHAYIQFIAPGLIMMQIVMSAYNGSVSSFFIAKFHRNIEEILVSPMHNFSILLGFMSGGLLRALLITVIISTISAIFVHIAIHSFFLVFLSAFITACIFSLAGLINAVYARDFDDIAIVPTFVLAPLTYLGGVFYSIQLLPSVWQHVSRLNPILYMVSTFRYGFLNLTGLNILFSYGVMVSLLVFFFLWAMRLFKKAAGLRQ